MGFLTCSILISDSGLRDVHLPNLGKQKPLIFKQKDYKSWLDKSLKIQDLKPLIKFHEHYDFISHPIKESFYRNSDIFEHIIQSDQYNTIMKVARN